MGHFRPYPGNFSQNDEVSTVCTTDTPREGVADTPTDHRSKLLLVICSSSAQRGLLTVFSTGPLLTVLHLIMTETWFWGPLVSEACGRSIMRSIWVNYEVNMGQLCTKLSKTLS